jgi:hypothetical protein
MVEAQPLDGFKRAVICWTTGPQRVPVRQGVPDQYKRALGEIFERKQKEKQAAKAPAAPQKEA